MFKMGDLAAQSEERVTLDFGVMSLSPTLGIGYLHK